MRKFIITLALILAGTGLSMAQFGSSTDAASLAYDPQEIAQDFEDRVDNPVASNQFVQQFFIEFQVPQTGTTSQSLKQVWINWATNHPAAIEEYLIRRKQNHDQFN